MAVLTANQGLLVLTGHFILLCSPLEILNVFSENLVVYARFYSIGVRLYLSDIPWHLPMTTPKTVYIFVKLRYHRCLTGFSMSLSYLVPLEIEEVTFFLNYLSTCFILLFSFYTSCKIPENLWFSLVFYVFRGYRTRPVAWFG